MSFKHAPFALKYYFDFYKFLETNLKSFGDLKQKLWKKSEKENQNKKLKRTN